MSENSVISQRVRKLIGIIVICGIILLCSSEAYRSITSMPDHVRLIPGEEGRDLLLRTPVFLSVHNLDEADLLINGESVCRAGKMLDFGASLTVEAAAPGVAKLDVRLLGILPFHRITVEAVSPARLMPGGHSIGVVLESAGVMVIDHTPVQTQRGERFPARKAGILPGDILLSAGGVSLQSKDHLLELVEQAGEQDESLLVEAQRDGEMITLGIVPLFDRNQGGYRIGLWVKDGTAGVGTLTAYRPDSLHYIALGHQIIEPRIRQRIPVGQGYIVSADISGIAEAEEGTPGEKIGIFASPEHALGSVDANTHLGIVGQLWEEPVSHSFSEPIPVAFSEEVQTGPAEMITVVSGDETRGFDVEVVQTRQQAGPEEKSMVIEITDEELLSKAGGIVQGMSGSPILQDGKLVGAVTHVIMSDPARGYGVYAEWLARELGLLGEGTQQQSDELIGIAAFGVR